MDRSAAQGAGNSSLEDQLRSMILGNVTISSPESAREASNPGNHQGGRRGRGGFHRGNSRNAQTDQAVQNHTTAPAAQGFRRGRGQPHHHGYHARQAQPNGQAQHHPASANTAVTESNPQHHRRGPNPSRPRQFRQQGQPDQPNSSTTNMQAPRVLPRPQSNAAPNMPRPHFPLRGQGPQHTNQLVSSPVAQLQYLDQLASEEVPKAEISLAELQEKEAFRRHLEAICCKALTEGYSGDIVSISLVGFGSLASGFATPGSDIDLSVVPQWKNPTKEQRIEIDRDVPRLLERAILESKLGGRLLTRTRVPILKVCQQPSEELYKALYEERQKWDDLPEEEKYPVTPEPTPIPNASSGPKPLVEVDGEKSPDVNVDVKASNATKSRGPKSGSPKNNSPASLPTAQEAIGESNSNISTDAKERTPRTEKAWSREKVLSPLDFPKDGVGIQCDINFDNPLGIHNTQLLRCYSLTDPRVRPMVLFVKAWAKRRKINSSYSGTLSSYGWVLMVLHYLVNIVQPSVCSNLQLSVQQPKDLKELETLFKDSVVGGYEVKFWKNEDEILEAAHAGQITQNNQSLGALLRGFYQYYASVPTGYMYGPRPPSFHWTSEVLSLRTPGGVRSKAEKGWTGAKTTISAGKEVRHRYLFAIEDPFEIDHNVARTVTHHGIVAIRDEFRRAWRILSAVGLNQLPEGGLFDQIVEQPPATPSNSEDKKTTVEHASTRIEGKPATAAIEPTISRNDDLNKREPEEAHVATNAPATATG